LAPGIYAETIDVYHGRQVPIPRSPLSGDSSCPYANVVKVSQMSVQDNATVWVNCPSLEPSSAVSGRGEGRGSRGPPAQSVRRPALEFVHAAFRLLRLRFLMKAPGGEGRIEFSGYYMNRHHPPRSHGVGGWQVPAPRFRDGSGRLIMCHCRRTTRMIARTVAVVGALLAVPALATPIEPGAVRVIDGDTIEARGAVFRLVGFDTPETGSRARCESERTLAAAASRRLPHLIAGGGLDLERVACSCRPGTEGTPACNHGWLCGTLRARGDSEEQMKGAPGPKGHKGNRGAGRAS
jgi:hypothetical protein